MTHWVEAWIGTPWVAGETDCWNFARLVWAAQFHVVVPAVPVDHGSQLDTRRALRDADMSNWQMTETPSEGDAVLMARGERPCHVGIWLAPALVLHSIETAGVICTPERSLHQTGYRITGTYRRIAR